ncbi:MAG: hypothetical protein OQJ96_02310 [Flavobacteriales bacterium]|nr:hypothetical protein [Flavobacteriales bacterium]MCW8912758.1 hypothetical protein [Flavobacteriales bacterium]MCW8936869.1 hypothetical protein [Flavobacteriales bacterium]MCW8939237.1 hypothetical protein [Flavobacteriales bacterium]MCW8968074.1 hypothetical protein [Flavobacteriales bacterium]
MEFLIQKIASCCSSQQLDLFEAYLAAKNQLLSQKLIHHIKNKPHQNIDFYCKAVYGTSGKETLKKFNQLNHHTLNYFSFISQHFPTFLSQNVSDVEWFIYHEEHNKAIEKLKLLVEVAKKFEDFGLLVHLFEITQQNKLLYKAMAKQINLVTQKEYLTFYNDLRILLQIQDELTSTTLIEEQKRINPKDLAFFKNHFNSPSLSIQIIARQSYLNILSSYNDKSFYNKNTLELIEYTKKLAEKHAYLMIAHHREKLMSLDYMLVKHTRLTLGEKEINKTCSSIINKWQKFYHANNQLDSGLMLALSIKGSFFITDYFCKPLNDKLKLEVKEIISLFEELGNKLDWEKVSYLKYINFYNVYAMFLILDNQEKTSVKLIEKVLHEYQQKTFKKMYDGLFVVLLMAHFQAKDFDAIIDNYSRYKKLTKNFVSMEENDLVIKAIYYIAQLKIAPKNQYEKKLNDIIKSLKSNPHLNNNLLLVERMMAF